MAKVFGIHEIMLKPDVNVAEFEEFVSKELLPAPSLPGAKVYMLKGDQGERIGKYGLIWEWESVEARNRCFPRGGEESEVVHDWQRANKAAVDKWHSFLERAGTYTDYVMLES